MLNYSKCPGQILGFISHWSNHKKRATLSDSPNTLFYNFLKITM
jgi:hypothetical protein